MTKEWLITIRNLAKNGPILIKSKAEQQKTKANYLEERKKEPYRASMEAMEPPGTNSMKMFTTPPSKLVPMNLKVFVRKSFRNDKERTLVRHKIHVYIKRQESQIKLIFVSQKN